MKSLLAISVTVTLLAISARPAVADQCAPISPSRGFDEAHAVFTGKVVQAKRHKWVIAVDGVWKGEVDERIILRHRRPGRGGEFQYKLGKGYLFFTVLDGFEHQNAYETGQCNWTIELKRIYTEEEDGSPRLLEELMLQGRGEGRPPVKKYSRERPINRG